ncbi:hypothetical protein IIE26_26970 (plasmid) [Cytobacillus oceanisediminis]|uniref:hypothetical protein n=1 Tax=Cytobacillus oceanisediminis TaxID=665099 RepID=UPI001864981C|nr:hypothetical protein [Cytobacillus oceanisediminis]QOK30012.1 hypothetical protein IIE26_26970 [Cytobacillus oceanisediminis]
MKGIKLEELKRKLSLLSHPAEPVETAVDLFDIYESSIDLMKLIEDIESIQDKDALVDKLIELEIELDHINWHYKSLKKDLKKLYNLN